jgi:hypothetical protein
MSNETIIYLICTIAIAILMCLAFYNGLTVTRIEFDGHRFMIV